MCGSPLAVASRRHARCGWAHCGGLSCCRAQAPGSAGCSVATHGLWGARSVAVWAELPHSMWGLSGPGIKPIACVGRWIPNHWTTREVENFFSGKFTFDLCIRKDASILCCVCSSHFSINLSDSQ